MRKKKIKVLVGEILILFILVILAALIHKNNSITSEYMKSEYTIVEADVVTAEHTESSLYYYTDTSGDIPRQISKRIPESYKVILKYKDTTKEYDSISMYNKCKGKDKVKVQICTIDYKGNKTTAITDVY